jgi:hypothetical protein
MIKRKYGEYTPGEYVCSPGNGIVTKEYSAWTLMLTRCYDEDFKLKWPTYRDCKCADEFFVFQSFASWYTSQIGYSKECHLDKDLMVRDNKLYSPDTCLLLPPQVNTLLNYKRFPDRGLPTGVSYDYKRDKYVAQVNRCGKYVMLGRFNRVEEAEQAYKYAKVEEVRRVGEAYKEVLDPRAYEALINYRM